MALGLTTIHTHITTKGQISVTRSTGPQMLFGHRENMQTLTERPLVPHGGPGTTKIPSDLRGVEIGAVRQACGAGAAQPQHLLPE